MSFKEQLTVPLHLRYTAGNLPFETLGTSFHSQDNRLFKSKCPFLSVVRIVPNNPLINI